MSTIRHIARGSCLVTMIALLAGCVIAPGGGPGYHRYHEGYYDRDHHRYWHDNGWRQCGYNDSHCH